MSRAIVQPKRWSHNPQRDRPGELTPPALSLHLGNLPVERCLNPARQGVVVLFIGGITASGLAGFGRF
jgi:hypothetical protein